MTIAKMVLINWNYYSIFKLNDEIKTMLPKKHADKKSSLMVEEFD